MFGISHDCSVKDFLKLAQLRIDRPDVDFLGRLVRSFMRFPYENLTKIVRANEESDPMKRLRLPEIVFGEHVEFGAGGTCFSLTYYFRRILERCGYPCETVLCDRSYGADTHCALIVALNGSRYLVDPGYLLEHPLEVPIRGSSSIATPMNEVRLARLGETSQCLLITKRGGKEAIRYRLKDVSVSDETFLEKWIDSFSWAQMRHLCLTRLEKDGQIYMRDGHLRYSTAERRAHESLSSGYESRVSETFGIKSEIVGKARSYLK